jgi:hypothetical protein
LVDEGKKVFITGPTHTAINNCLNSISKEISDRTKVVKIGEKYQASEISNNPYILRKSRLPFPNTKLTMTLVKEASLSEQRHMHYASPQVRNLKVGFSTM